MRGATDPIFDHNLCPEAERLCTGEDVHDVRSMTHLYRSWHDFAREPFPNGWGWDDSPLGKPQRVKVAEKEAEIRAFIAKARLRRTASTPETPNKEAM